MAPEDPTLGELRPDSERSRSANRVAAALFCAALALPALASALKLDPSEADPRPVAEWREIREAVGTPRHAIELLRSRIDRRFGLRDALVRAHARVTVDLLHTSTTARVVLGSDHWLYLADEEAMDSHRNLRPFSAQTLRGFRTLLEKQQRWFEQRGIEFLLVIAPDKATIAAEGVPARFAVPLHPHSRLDQLVAELAAGRAAGGAPAQPLPLLDLRAALRAEQRDGAVYAKSDTHWNDRGAWVAYREIIERLRSRVPHISASHTRDQFTRGERILEYGDLARMLGLGNTRRERVPHWLPRFEGRAAAVPSLLPLREIDVETSDVVISASSDERAPRALILRDSFGSALVPLLSEHFSFAQYVWHSSFEFTDVTEKLLDSLRPQVVIAVLAERRLMGVGTSLASATPRKPARRPAGRL